MEVKKTNPFNTIRDLTVCGKWVDVKEFAVIAGFQLKLAGVMWKTSNELADILFTMVEVGFLEYDGSNPFMVRVKEEHYGQVSV